MKKKLLISALLLVSGAAFSQDPEPVSVPKKTVETQEPVIYDMVDEPADFPGGVVALRKYMSENLRYPQMALERGLQGKCFLQFYVMKDGSISNVQIKKGVVNCPECDQEAVRMVKSMPKWRPGKISEKAVNSTFSLPVTFKLN
ncbi:energy transducer TonB [Fluviicola taffensis]|uniref:energy transducer TonB n=1 Tax=Fluviicola taffensis TaxID=191579 RepID=UPI0031383083